jgi:CRP-like cAMP-binding protein
MEAKQVTSGFAVDIDHLHALGVVDPYSSKSMELYSSGQLSSEERLYFTLWGSSQLSTTSFGARQKLAVKGAEVHAGYFIVSGQLLGIDGDAIYRLGPGSVIGLAEGIGGLPYSMSVVAVGPVQARLISMNKVDQLMRKMPTGLKGVLRSAVMRTLALKEVPEHLK